MEFWLELDSTASADLDRRREFIYNTFRIINYLNTECFKRVSILPIRQIRIQLTDNVDVLDSIEPPTKIFPVCRVILKYDIVGFFECGERAKKEKIIEILARAFFKAQALHELNSDYFLDVINKIKQADYAFVIRLNKRKKNADKSMEVYIQCDVGTDNLRFSLITLPINGSVYMEIPITSINNATYFDVPNNNSIIFDGSWNNNSVYVAYNNSKEIFYEIDVDKSACMISFKPIGGTTLEYLTEKYEYVTTEQKVRREKLRAKWWR